jgi:hypothetical protein
MEKQQTLNEKEAQLLESIAVPTAEDWSFLVEGELRDGLVAQANQILLTVLGELRANHISTFGDIARAVYTPLGELSKAYPEACVLDSEALTTVARFFGLNYSPALYHHMRFGAAL